MNPSSKSTPTELTRQREEHAACLARGETLQLKLDLTLSEALVLGLLRQGVRTYLTVLGHGSTEIGEVLRIYQKAGLLRIYGLRSEIEASHAATALRWVTGKKAAVITSIGPGALQAMSASLTPASDGIGVWYLFGDETSEDEGFNMQQIPKHAQGLFLNLASVMGDAYSLHSPGALATALARGAGVVDHPPPPPPI
jgi:3D-(3,5/4)-trihydroxycyclohexane-1,2-dione acylhydrolase (decyclizing)